MQFSYLNRLFNNLIKLSKTSQQSAEGLETHAIANIKNFNKVIKLSNGSHSRLPIAVKHSNKFNEHIKLFRHGKVPVTILSPLVKLSLICLLKETFIFPKSHSVLRSVDMSNKSPLSPRHRQKSMDTIVKKIGLVCALCPRNSTHRLTFRHLGKLNNVYLCPRCFDRVKLFMQASKGYEVVKIKEIVITPEKVTFT